MMSTQSNRDQAQDEQIQRNAERITRNEEAIRRQTEALEQIRDHYYPPPDGWLRKSGAFAAKVVCVIVAYLGIAETVDWIWNLRESKSMAADYAKVAERLFFREGNAAGASQCYEKALELDQGNPDYSASLAFMKGMALSSESLSADRPLTDDEREQLDLTMADAAMMLEADPGSTRPHLLMGQALFMKGDRVEALSEIDRAVACDPENASVRVTACVMNFAAGRTGESRRHLAEAERLNPKLPLVACWKGMHALSIDHDAAKAIGHFREMVKTSPRLAIGHAMIGRALLAAERADIAGARESFGRALTLDAKLIVAMVGMAETYEREGNLIVARLWLDKAIDCDANGIAALVARARISGRLGEWNAAEDDLTAAIGIDRFRADLYRLRGDAREKSGDAEEAKSDRAIAAALSSAISKKGKGVE